MIIATLEERIKSFLDKMAVIHPDIEVLGTYVGSKTKIECKCKIDGTVWSPIPNALLNGRGCPSCRGAKISKSKTKTQEQFVQSIQKKNPDIEVVGEYTGLYNPVRCKCPDCNYEFDILATCLVWQRRRCPLCTNRVVVRGVNDVATTHPDLAKYFKNKEEAFQYCATNAVNITFKCPTCGDEHIHQLNVVSRKGYTCGICSEKISFPNKVIRGLLTQLNAENFEYEYSPDWAGNYLYDATFTKNGQRYVVEMDGGFHFKVAHFEGYTEEDLKARQRADEIKDNLARENNCTVIHIHCYPERMSHISREIQQSLLAKLFDLSAVNWNNVVYYNEDLLKDICSAYANNCISVAGLAKQFDIERHTIVKFLNKGTALGLCNYDPKRSKTIVKQVSVMCADVSTNESYIYESIMDAYNTLIEKGIKTSFRTVAEHSKVGDSYKGFILTRV